MNVWVVLPVLEDDVVDLSYPFPETLTVVLKLAKVPGDEPVVYTIKV